MLRVGLIGLGKMGISHLAMVNAHPGVKLVALCDPSPIVPNLISKYMDVALYSDFNEFFEKGQLDAVFIATPTQSHGPLVRAALDRGIHVFCEKPFCLDAEEGRALAQLAEQKGLVNQVGYHYRFVGAFREAKRLIDAGVLGTIHHLRAEAYGPVVLRPKGSTWRTSKGTGGGCLYDYACHAIDLVTYLVGKPADVSGTVLNKIFSRDVEDEVYANFRFANGVTGQLAANWSDESYRKMSTKLTVWGTNGRLNVDRQEVQAFIRDPAGLAVPLKQGWNISYTTDLTDPCWFYLRGEEYSEQIDHFVKCINDRSLNNISSFASAIQTDEVVAMMLKDASEGWSPRGANLPATATQGAPAGGLLKRMISSLR